MGLEDMGDRDGNDFLSAEPASKSKIRIKNHEIHKI
jgi:hypothetical protein